MEAIANEDADTVLILTYKGEGTVFWDGGIQSFPVDQDRVRGLKYCVVVRNANGHKPEDDRPHGTAFLVGRIKEVVRSREPAIIAEEASPDFKGRRRSLILFSEWAPIDIPGMWQKHGSRYSAQYRVLSDLGIDPSTLNWNSMPSNMEKAASGADPTQGYDHPFDEGREPEDLASAEPTSIAAQARRVMDDAKAKIAAHFGVTPDRVSIDIRY